MMAGARLALGLAALVLVALASLASGFPAHADQKSPRVAGLLDRLGNAKTPAEAEQLESVIWKLWVHHEDSEIQRFMAIGISAMTSGNLEMAFTAFDRVVGMDPEFAEGWNKRATVNYMMERLDASMNDIERTLALEPRHFGALSGMGLIFDAIDNPKAAADAWEKALGIHPFMPGVRRHIRELRQREKGRAI
jgi:tetratricopeptide (TPR) repeat protein